jgi:hypothetical protein
VLVLRGNHRPNTGAFPSSLQPVQIPALAQGGKDNGLDSCPMPAGRDVRATFQGDI